MARRTGAPTPALTVLERAGVTHHTHPYESPGRAHSYGTDAAAALGVDPRRVFKTLVVDSSALEHPTIFCSAGRRGLQVELAAADLVATASATTAGVAAQ